MFFKVVRVCVSFSWHFWRATRKRIENVSRFTKSNFLQRFLNFYMLPIWLTIEIKIVPFWGQKLIHEISVPRLTLENLISAPGANSSIYGKSPLPDRFGKLPSQLHLRASLQEKRVTLANRLKLALVYKQISQVGLPYHPGQLYKLCWRVSSCVKFTKKEKNIIIVDRTNLKTHVRSSLDITKLHLPQRPNVSSFLILKGIQRTSRFSFNKGPGYQTTWCEYNKLP